MIRYTSYDRSTSMLKSGSQAALDLVAALIGTAQAASTAALSVGAGAILVTAWLDHAGIGAVLTDPSRLHRCLTIAGVTALARSLVYILRCESMPDHVVASAECAVSMAPAVIHARTAPPPTQSV